MDYYNNHNHNANKSSAPQPQVRRKGFPKGMFQKKSQFEDPNSNHITKTNTGFTGSTDAGCEPQLEPTINTTGGWARPTLAGWALPADRPLGDDVAARTDPTTMARPKTKPVSGGLFKGKSSIINSREAVKKYGGKFIFK